MHQIREEPHRLKFLDRERKIKETATFDEPSLMVVRRGKISKNKKVLVDKGRIQRRSGLRERHLKLAPEREFSLALHDLTIDEKQDFARR